MWLEKDKYRDIRFALNTGREKDLDRLLKEISGAETRFTSPITVCPVCHKSLIRQALPYLEFFVAACPDFHGLWMSPEISKKLREVIGQEKVVAGKRSGVFQGFISMAYIVVVLAFLGYALQAADQWYRRVLAQTQSARNASDTLHQSAPANPNI